MARFSLPAVQLPFVLGGSDQLSVNVGTTSLSSPLTPDVGAIFAVGTNGAGEQPVTISGGGWGTIAIHAGTTFDVTAVWPASEALIARHGLAPYFAANVDDVVLVLELGGSADEAFTGRFTYAPLTADFSVNAGNDFAFTFANGYKRDQPLNALLTTLFRDIKLPAKLDTPPGPGEIIKFEYGGYLSVGASIGVGYSLQGTPSIALGQLQLSEACALSALGTLGLSTKVAGFFQIEIRAAIDAGGRLRPGWAHIVVRKTRSSEFAFAADVSVGVTANLQGLPEAPNDFLGALLGVNAQNWLNLLDHVRTVDNWSSLRTELDDLAVDFLASWTGQPFDRLSTTTSFADFRARVQKVADARRSVDPAALAIFDRYFDDLTSAQPGGAVARDLERLAHLPSWDDLKGNVPPQLWDLVTHLTDGDPLGWIAGKAIDLLRTRAASVLALKDPAATGELTGVIGLAKHTFGFDQLAAPLAAIDTGPKLEAAAGTRAGAFVERLLGASVARMQAGELGSAVARLRQVLDRAHDFEQRARAKFTDVVTGNVALAAHAEYRNATGVEALIDIAVDMTSDEGTAIVRAAALGDFSEALSSYRPDVVQLNHGRLTHNVVKQNTVAVNVVGWHAGWHYQGIDKVVVATDQQIVTDAGSMTVYTTTDLSQGRERKRQHERTYTNLLLRFIGESRGAVVCDPRTEQYLIDALTGMSASYELAFEDDRTTLDELAYYLSFASAFGIVDAGVQPGSVAALLPLSAKNDFGAMSASYEVRYGEDGLRRLFTTALDEATVRKTMRQVILSSYLRVGGAMGDVGWAYWTPGVFDVWIASTPAFVSLAARELAPIAPSPFAGIAAPRTVVLAPEQQRTLDALYGIEQHLVAGFTTLAQLIRSSGAGRSLPPNEFENALSSVGDALKLIDDFGESVNTTFAVFDTMLRHVEDAPRASTLTLRSQAAGRTLTKMFLS
jgi:hypothetical protein